MDAEKRTLYEVLLMLEANKLGTSKVYGFPTQTEDQIYEAIYQAYLENENTNNFKISKKNKRQLYEWIKDKARYDLLNELIRIIISPLIHTVQTEAGIQDITDHFLIENFSFLIHIITDSIDSFFSDNKSKDVNLSTITTEELHILVRKFLEKIDPSLDWLFLYDQALKNKKVIYINDLDEDEKEEIKIRIGGPNSSYVNLCDSCIMIDEELYIFINLTGTISDVRAMIHEFIHYISDINLRKKHQNKIQQSLLEFPSIFYELCISKFLENEGYKKEEISCIRNIRLENLYDLLLGNGLFWFYMDMYLKKGSISEQQDIAIRKENIQKSLSLLPMEIVDSLKSISPNLFDAKKSAYSSCDACIQQIVYYPRFFQETYTYFIGYYLATHAILLDLNILPQMKQITENLDSINPADVFKMVGCELENAKQKNLTFK